MAIEALIEGWFRFHREDNDASRFNRTSIFRCVIFPRRESRALAAVATPQPDASPLRRRGSRAGGP